MILISKTYQTVTPESAEHGDYADCGLMYVDKPMTFGDLLSEIEDLGYCELSKSGEIDEYTWITGEVLQDADYWEKGEETRYSLHLSDANKPSALKYWIWALEWLRLKT